MEGLGASWEASEGEDGDKEKETGQGTGTGTGTGGAKTGRMDAPIDNELDIIRG